MKNLRFIPVAVLLWFNLHAQVTYTVTTIKGEASRNGVNITLNDRITSNDRITLKTKESMLILLNPKGRYVISVKQGAKPNELKNILVRETINLHAKNVRLSTRALQDYLDIKDYFETNDSINTKLLIVEEAKIAANSSGVRIDNKENFYFLQSAAGSGTAANNMLPVLNDSLVIRTGDFIFNGRPYREEDGRVTIGLVQIISKERKVTRIVGFAPAFLTRTELRQIIRAVKSALPDAKREDMINEVYTQLYFLYGKPDKQIVESLFDNAN